MAWLDFRKGYFRGRIWSSSFVFTLCLDRGCRCGYCFWSFEFFRANTLKHFKRLKQAQHVVQNKSINGQAFLIYAKSEEPE